MPFARRMLLTMVLGNLGGALLSFAYFRYLDPSAFDGTVAPRPGETSFFIVGFVALVVAGRWAFRRWSHSLLRASGPLPQHADHAALHRRALRVPAFAAALTFVGWACAAVFWGVLWPWLIGTLNGITALRQILGIMFVPGALVALFIYLATERLWRERLPLLFPAGNLAAVGARSLRVRTRLLVVFLMMSILPMVVLSVATRVRVQSLRTMDLETARLTLDNLLLVQVALVTVGVLLALVLARFVADSVAEPLRQLQAAMNQVEQGNLDVQCAVVSNDELGAVTEGFNRMVSGLRERERIRDTFGKYVSPQVRDEILAGRASLAGGQRDVTILFADLRGFSTWVEASAAADVVQGLNAYFTEMDIAIRAHGGLVLQYIGDEIEAVFGAPLSDPQHAEHAVAAALDMQARLEAWNRRRRAAGEQELHHGIGIHSGTVVAGNIGSAERMSYALVGDAVNVASRIEALNKEFGTRILVSGATRGRLGDASALQPLQAVRVKGRSAEVEVYRLA